MAYSTAQVGNSGWHAFDSTSEYQVYSFGYSVPKMKKANSDSIGIWADTQGKGRGSVVKSAYVVRS